MADDEYDDDEYSVLLQELTPDIVAWYGEAPEGIKLIGRDVIPQADYEALTTELLGAMGNLGSVVGNLSLATTRAQGFYRLSDASSALIKNGATLAVKDGASLGSIFQNGKIVAQARFIPVSSLTIATATATVGPAVAMLGLQMQLGELSELVSTNVDLTTEVLKSIRNEQWSELEGLAESIDEAYENAMSAGAVNDTIWSSVSSKDSDFRKQERLYSRNVAEHIKELDKRKRRARRNYLQLNAEAIVFDTHALLRPLKMSAQYQALYAGRARARSTDDESEAKLFDEITQKAPEKIEESVRQITQLTSALYRTLGLISELPGKGSMPLSRKRKDTDASKQTSAKLLEAIEHLATMILPATDPLATPETVCAPEGLDLDRYLKILRWILDDGEQLLAIAFPFDAGSGNSGGVKASILGKRIDASWDALTPTRVGKVNEMFARSTLVAVTDLRIITADPKGFLEHGDLANAYPIDQVRFVRPRKNYKNYEDPVRETIGVTTEFHDLKWMFPDGTNAESIDALTATIIDGAHGQRGARTEITASSAHVENQ